MKTHPKNQNAIVRLDKLRLFMSTAGIAAYIVPSADPHQSEYVPTCWRRRAFMSEFTGSAGELVVTLDRAVLWTDSRYYLQAEIQLQGTTIELFKAGLPDIPDMGEWLTASLAPGQRVGVDPKLFSKNAYSKLNVALSAGGLQIQRIDDNPIDAIWADRPPLPLGVAVPHPEKFAGESIRNRLSRVRKEMKSKKGEVLLVTTLDALAWVFNIRGNDVQYNPVVIGYGAVEQEKALLFIDARKVTTALRNHLGDNVEIREYAAFEAYLLEIAHAPKTVLVESDTADRRVVDLLQGSCTPIFVRSPITTLKAKKNEIEIQGIKSAHIRDGTAMVRFLSWLDDAVCNETVTEISAAEKLETFRQVGDHYVGPSFGTISGFGPNGAVVHYEASTKTNRVIEGNGIYLVDSGAQYLDGTTDITRTIAVGAPTAEQKDRFTRVLKGHINLAGASFPAGTTGNRLDTIARKPLWDVGLNYGHGTGHGVGAYLGVHEGPHAISYYRGTDVALVEGMVLSNEPGYYKEGAYGIRIENLLRVVQNNALSHDGDPFLAFEILTFCPIDLRLVETRLLNPDEIKFLNAYHEKVRSVLLPLVDEATRNWLEHAAREI